MKRLLLSRTFPLGVSNLHGKENIISPTWASESKSCNLLLQAGMIAPSSAGVFHLMPPMLRAVNKLESLIDDHMSGIGGQKLQLSSLGNKSLWQKTGRWEEFGEELVTTQIGSSTYCLCPTHEEAICSVVSQYVKQLSHTHLPLRLYQTTSKYRGELRPHGGLLRCREFTMNDLYSFDVNLEAARETYAQVSEMYRRIFADLGVEVIVASADTGVIGGDISHEFHVECDVGEDKISICEETGEAWNSSSRGESGNTITGVEVGHTFLLGSKYSRKLNAVFVDERGRSHPCEMGCFGLGVTRIVAACVETMATERGMRWPVAIAPYKVCIVPPKSGSREETHWEEESSHQLYDRLREIPQLHDDVIIDDRTKRTIGWRLQRADLIGYPVVIVIGKGIKDEYPTVEIIFQGKHDRTEVVPLSSVVDYVKDYFVNFRK